jgi:hypothetical protein
MIISFSDQQLQSIFAASRQVSYEDRARYLVLIADSLDVDDVEIGDGSVARAVAQAVRTIPRRPPSACLTPKFHDPPRSP